VQRLRSYYTEVVGLSPYDEVDGVVFLASGGYGPALERDPNKVADDVLDEVISVETALRDYGVVVSAKGVVDVAATAKARAGR